MKILVLNGPNINFVGIREKGIYGTKDYAWLKNMLEEKAAREGHEIEVFHSNYEAGSLTGSSRHTATGQKGSSSIPERLPITA